MSNNNYDLYGGSICITDLMDALKKGHSAFTKSPKNGKVYCNIVEFVREAPDDFGQHVSILMSSTKDKKEQEKAAYGKLSYIGNLKKIESNAPVTERAASNVAADGWDANVPMREQNTNGSNTASDLTEPLDDLPF